MEQSTFGYDCSLNTDGFTLYLTEDAIALDKAGGESSDAYSGVRVISSEGDVEDFEIFGRVGDTTVDIVKMGKEGGELEEVELPTGLGIDDKQVLSAIAEAIDCSRATDDAEEQQGLF